MRRHLRPRMPQLTRAMTTDEQLLEIMEEVQSGAPRLDADGCRFFLVAETVLVICQRVGSKQGHRWAFGLGDVRSYPPAWVSREVVTWWERKGVNLVAHGHAMGARTL